jgi:hypothetical protein
LIDDGAEGCSAHVSLRHELNQCVAHASHRDLFVGLERLAFAHGHDIELMQRPHDDPRQLGGPDGVVVRYMISRLGGFKKHCSAYHAVIEGHGFGVAVKRGVITTLLQFSQTRSVLFVHARVASVLKIATEQGLVAVRSVLEEAQRRGLSSESRWGRSPRTERCVQRGPARSRRPSFRVPEPTHFEKSSRASPRRLLSEGSSLTDGG